MALESSLKSWRYFINLFVSLCSDIYLLGLVEHLTILLLTILGIWSKAFRSDCERILFRKI